MTILYGLQIKLRSTRTNPSIQTTSLFRVNRGELGGILTGISYANKVLKENRVLSGTCVFGCDNKRSWRMLWMENPNWSCFDLVRKNTQNFLTLRWIFCRFHPCRRRVSNFPVLIRDSNLFAFIWVNYFQRRCFWEYIGWKNRVMDVWRLARTVWSRRWVWIISFFDMSRFRCITSNLFYVNPTWLW